ARVGVTMRVPARAAITDEPLIARAGWGWREHGFMPPSAAGDVTRLLGEINAWRIKHGLKEFEFPRDARDPPNKPRLWHQTHTEILAAAYAHYKNNPYYSIGVSDIQCGVCQDFF